MPHHVKTQNAEGGCSHTKLPAEKIAMILIICIAAVAIFCICILSGTILHSLNLSANSSTKVIDYQTSPLFLDSEYDIGEANMSLITGRTIIHVTPDEIRTIPGLEEAVQETTTDPNAWVEGWRSVKSFEGNGTQYDTFVKKVCSGKKTLAECFSNNGTFFEYQGHYYDISHRYTRGPQAPFPPGDLPSWTANAS